MATKSANLKKTEPVATTAVAVKKPAAKKTTGTAVVDVNAVRESLRAQAAAMAERTQPPGGNKIVLGNDKLFKLPDGSKVETLKAVIVDFITAHSYYEGAYDSKNIVPPGCFAMGQNPKDLAPVADAPNRQAENCQVCPMNEFGSAGAGKACKNSRRLALLPLNDEGTDVDPEADILIFDVSPTAIKGYDGYVQSVARTYQMPPIGVITTISADPNVEHQKAVFSDAELYSGVADAMARQEEAREMLAVKPDFTGYAPVQKAPARKAGVQRR